MKKAVLLWSAMVMACEGGCSEVASASVEEAIPSPEEAAGGAGEAADVVCHVRGSDVSGALKIPQVSIEELSLRDAQELLSAQSSAHEVLLSQEQVCSPMSHLPRPTAHAPDSWNAPQMHARGKSTSLGDEHPVRHMLCT